MSEKKSDMMKAIMEQMSFKTGPQKPVIPETDVKISSSSKKSKSKKMESTTVYHTSDEIFSSNNKRQIKELLSSPRAKFEVEASFGIFKDTGRFQPGLKSLFQFNNLRRYLDRIIIPNGGSLYLRTYSDRVDTIRDNYVRRMVDRSSALDDTSYQRKDRFSNQFVDNSKWGIRISKSSEENVDESDFDGEKWEEIENLRKNAAEKKDADDVGRKNIRDIAVQRFQKVNYMV